MNLEDILKEWESDCEIGHRLDKASQDTPLLHGKYLNYLTQAKLILKRSEAQQASLLKDKFLWYNGKLPQEDIDRYGWSPDPFPISCVLAGRHELYPHRSACPGLRETQ